MYILTHLWHTNNINGFATFNVNLYRHRRDNMTFLYMYVLEMTYDGVARWYNAYSVIITWIKQ